MIELFVCFWYQLFFAVLVLREAEITNQLRQYFCRKTSFYDPCMSKRTRTKIILWLDIETQFRPKLLGSVPSSGSEPTAFYMRRTSEKNPQFFSMRSNLD